MNNALRINLVINEFSWHIFIGACESMRKMLFKKKKTLHRLITITAYQTNLTQNGSHFFTSVKVSYKQVSNIKKIFSTSHIFYLDRPKTSVVAVNSIHFSSSFIFIFDIFMPQKTLICTFYFFKAGDKNWVTLQSSVTWVSLARTRETLSWRLVEKPYVCARHVLFTNYLEFRSEDWQFIQMGCIIDH